MANSFSSTDPYIKREEAGSLNLGTTVAVTNKATDLPIGTAAATVDIAATININQTTAGRTLTVPDPTDTSTSKSVVINNVGTQSFSMLSQTVGAGTGITIAWNGVAWSVLSSSFAGTVAATGSVTSSSKIAGIGYATGAGAAGTQGTSRTTTVVINGGTGSVSGSITLFSAAGSATPFTFTVTNAAVAATDVVIVNQKSGTDKYETFVTAVGTGTFNITAFTTGGTTTETPVFNFAVIKGVAA